jgi:hypothetical protein
MVSVILPKGVMAVKVAEPYHVIVGSGFRCIDGGGEVVIESRQSVVMCAIIVDVK